ncbi:hypothetical protein ACFSVJ_19735 [Prauserella oleivorans]
MLSWRQPVPAQALLRTVEMPCPHGCGGHWTHPQAERDHVIDAEGEPDPRGA